MDMLADNPAEYARTWSDLNRRLRKIEDERGLVEALHALQHEQEDAGFIEDKLECVERHTYKHPSDPARFFHVQYNPRRALRFSGTGKAVPPNGVQALNNGCYLCRDNIRWQQRGVQLGYEISSPNSRYYALMNPFPLLPGHMVLAAQEHTSQEWQFQTQTRKDTMCLLTELAALVARLPGYVGFYNGVDAGASIPGHLHFQFVLRPEDMPMFPLEAVAGDAYALGGSELYVDGYPLDAVVWRGCLEDIVEHAVEWMIQWGIRNAHRMPDLSANFVATRGGSEADLTLYFVPRDRNKSRAEGLPGLVGGLEVLGELVFSTPEEKQLLDHGRVDYFVLERALKSVRTPLYD